MVILPVTVKNNHFCLFFQILCLAFLCDCIYLNFLDFEVNIYKLHVNTCKKIFWEHIVPIHFASIDNTEVLWCFLNIVIIFHYITKMWTMPDCWRNVWSQISDFPLISPLCLPWQPPWKSAFCSHKLPSLMFLTKLVEEILAGLW